MNKPHTRRILKIGNKLVKGPDAIFNIQGRDWVEKDLQIIFYKPGLATIESISIWSDRTMNKYKNFLPPLIRMLKWDRKTDMENLRLNKQRDFPMIELDLGLIISDKFEEVSQKFIDLQKTVIKIHNYIPYKISTQRDSADINVNYNEDHLDYSIYFRNGEQSFEFNSTGNLSEKLVQELLKFKKILIDSTKVIDKSDWKERYYELTEEYLEGKIPEWYYQNRIGE